MLCIYFNNDVQKTSSTETLYAGCGGSQSDSFALQRPQMSAADINISQRPGLERLERWLVLKPQFEQLDFAGHGHVWRWCLSWDRIQVSPHDSLFWEPSSSQAAVCWGIPRPEQSLHLESLYKSQKVLQKRAVSTDNYGHVQHDVFSCINTRCQSSRMWFYASENPVLDLSPEGECALKKLSFYLTWK